MTDHDTADRALVERAEQVTQRDYAHAGEWGQPPADVTDLIEQLSAALARRIKEGEQAWKPIETAPRDGTAVLVAEAEATRLRERVKDYQDAVAQRDEIISALKDELAEAQERAAGGELAMRNNVTLRQYQHHTELDIDRVLRACGLDTESGRTEGGWFRADRVEGFIERLRAERDAAREALRRYGRHTDECALERLVTLRRAQPLIDTRAGDAESFKAAVEKAINHCSCGLADAALGQPAEPQP